LETTDNSLIREIRCVEIINNHYFIRHGTFSEVLMFDSNGRFVRQVGQIGRGPGEYTSIYQIAADRDNQRLLLNARQGIMIFDGDGSFIQTIELKSALSMLVHDKHLYHVDRDVRFGSPDITLSLITHNTTDWNLIDSILITKYSQKIFFPVYLSQSKQSVYLYHVDMPKRMAGTSSVDTLFVFENQKLTPYLTMQVEDKKHKRRVSKIMLTDSYGIITHAISVQEPDSKYPRSVYSQYYINLHTMKGRNATNGFIDDFHGNNDVIITPIPNTNMFYYYRENNDYSLDLRTTPNPTLYIGTFKKKLY